MAKKRPPKPIKLVERVKDIQDYLKYKNYRDYVLFTLGVTTGYRAIQRLFLLVVVQLSS
ncbi:hypothetical protein [Clostridium sp. UBA5119]|uniref:hypothetical protein n=1 Tax=Clostridium sp. UBA5119 TaxID=1946366 RepID=UPI0039C8B30F